MKVSISQHVNCKNCFAEIGCPYEFTIDKARGVKTYVSETPQTVLDAYATCTICGAEPPSDESLDDVNALEQYAMRAFGVNNVEDLPKVPGNFFNDATRQ